MAAPFSGEDLFKRSLIGSILGFKIKTPKFHQQQQDQSNARQHSTTAPHFDFDQPCSSKTVLQLDTERQQNFVRNNYVQNLPSSRHLPRQQQQQPHSHQQERQPQQQNQQQQFCKQQNLAEHSIQTQFSIESDHKSRNYGSQTVGTVVENVSLSDQLSESLFLASPQALLRRQFSVDAQTVSYHPLVSSPHDIYQEIVYECEPFFGKHQLDQPILTSNTDSLIANASKTGAETEYRAEISNKNSYFLQSRNQAFSQSDVRPISAYTHVEPNQKFDDNVIQVNEIPYYRHQQQINQSSYCIPNTVGTLPPSSLSNASPLRVRHPTAPMNSTGGYCIENMEEQNSTSSIDIPMEDPKIIPPLRYDQHLPFPDEQLYYNSHDCKLPQPRSPSFYAADKSQPLNRNEYDYFIQDNFENEESFMKSAAEVLASKILLGVEVAPNSPQEAQAKKDEPKEQRQQKLGSILNGQVSLEELVKMVVAAVKEAGGLGGVVADREKQKLVTSPQPQPSIIHSSKRPETTASGETPEEILQRKRQQNNEAAARYRKRQRSARFIAEDEIRGLMRRNAEIKTEIAMVEREIEVLKEQFTIAQPIPRKRGVKPTNEKIEQ